MNQPPQTEKQTGKRIVSKGRYIVNFATKILSLSGGLFVLLLGVCLAIPGVIILVWVHDVVEDVFALVDFGTGATVLIRTGIIIIRESKRLVSGVPLTRANTADLPATESLVRASAEPVQEQQAVLLRAATETSEKHEEQLVRAAGGTE